MELGCITPIADFVHRLLNAMISNLASGPSQPDTSLDLSKYVLKLNMSVELGCGGSEPRTLSHVLNYSFHHALIPSNTIYFPAPVDAIPPNCCCPFLM